MRKTVAAAISFGIILSACTTKEQPAPGLYIEAFQPALNEPDEISITNVHIPEKEPAIQKAILQLPAGKADIASNRRIESILNKFTAPLYHETKITPGEVQTIELPGGMKVTIPANAFVDQSGNPASGEAVIRSAYYNSSKEILASSLVTQMTNGNLLVTGGMLYMDASINGKPCTLAEGKAITIDWPLDYSAENMQFYTGMRDLSGMITWDPLPDSLIRMQNAFLVKPDSLPSLPGDEDFLINHLYNQKVPNYIAGKMKRTKINYRIEIDEQGRIVNIICPEKSDPLLDSMVTASLKKLPQGKPAWHIDRTKRATIDTELDFNYQWRKNRYTDLSVKFLNAETILNGIAWRRRGNTTRIELRTLGWINLDKLLALPDLNDIYVKADVTDCKVVKLAFNDFRCVVTAAKLKNGYVFRNIPSGYNVTIFGMYEDSTNVYLGYADLRTDKNNSASLRFSPANTEDIDKFLGTLGAKMDRKRYLNCYYN